jgi:hypothetical protein
VLRKLANHFLNYKSLKQPQSIYYTSASGRNKGRISGLKEMGLAKEFRQTQEKQLEKK